VIAMFYLLNSTFSTRIYKFGADVSLSIRPKIWFEDEIQHGGHYTQPFLLPVSVLTRWRGVFRGALQY